ncbi:glycosyltransferase family 2 protein [Aureimonas sp. D3]|uniref:glycosyltransferase family 2 protein n=1 Tax=Aureimonas sp. D3 TaxID=1638164 RepID=UPI0009E9E9DB|nr:glycosyltransferase [Aureimonas sp. D3]
MTDLVIGIPTFRRPGLLLRLLESLQPEIAGRELTLIVADNDCDPVVETLVSEFPREAGQRFIYLPVSERGLSPNRNALVDAAMREAPDWRRLIMMDDDGYVSEGWLATLLACADTYEPHLVGGPVEGLLPPDAGLLARNSIFASRRGAATGPTKLLRTAQNLLISRRLLDLVERPLFRNAYKASGGEDYDLFRRVQAAGGEMVWCEEALVYEPPAEQLRPATVLKRYYTTGIYMSKIDQSYDGTGATWRLAVKGSVGALARFALSLPKLRKDPIAKNLLTIAHYSGRLVGMAGGHTSRYDKS